MSLKNILRLTMDEDWIENEFSTLYIGDARIDKRGKEIFSAFGNAPGSPISQVFKSWAEMKACYRFFSNARVTPEKLLSPHSFATIKRIKTFPVVLLPTDTTSGDYTDKPSIEGLGRLSANQSGDNYGIYVHPTLAVTPERLCLGVVGAKIWTREIKKSKLSRTEKKNRPIEEKEIYRWIESYNLACEVAEQTPKTQIISITDREGDFTDLFAEVYKRKEENPKSADVIVRSCQDRCLEEKEPDSEKSIKLRQALHSSSELGEIEFTLPATQGRKQRVVKQTIKARTVTFKGTKNRKIKINAVMAIEENPPEGEKALCWIFLTTLPIGTFEEAVRIIEYYLCRWEIEIFNKILKSGCKIEEKQLQTADRLMILIALFLILAWRIQYLMMLGRTCPNISSATIFEECEWKSVFKILHKNEPIPSEAPLLKDFIRMIAMLGGYIGRNNDPPPGPKVMWKGMTRMSDFSMAWEAFVGTE
jgi:hypothetical protein